MCSRLLGAGSRLDVRLHPAGDDVVRGRQGRSPVSMMGASQAPTSDQPAIAAAAAAQHGAAASPLHPAAEVVCLEVCLSVAVGPAAKSRDCWMPWQQFGAGSPAASTARAVLCGSRTAVPQPLAAGGVMTLSLHTACIDDGTLLRVAACYHTSTGVQRRGQWPRHSAKHF